MLERVGLLQCGGRLWVLHAVLSLELEVHPEAAPAASKRAPDGFHPRRRGRAEGGSFPFPQLAAARRRRSRAPFPSSPEHDYAACRPSKGRLFEF